ncbi:DUF4258 domain-containing protein [Candidatus Woesearchaeota archaeon]|nr:DUF4258 domain-containing protein [Candidatus Woesearchaeota archaeon]
MIIRLTDHARQRMSENAITLEMVRNALKYGSRTVQTDGLKATYGYYEVAYKKVGDIYVIKTVMVR